MGEVCYAVGSIVDILVLMKQNSQRVRAFSSVVFILIITSLMVVVTVVVFMARSDKSELVNSTTIESSDATASNATEPQSSASIPEASGNSSSQSPSNSNTPPLLIKHLGVNLDYYDSTTGMAGDFKFTKAKFGSGINLLFTDYGYVIKAANSSTGQDKANPQPTFILPLGSKVYSLVDGVVADIPKLYSNDYSIQVAIDAKDNVWRYETEHVINPLVKVGDKVKAGQVIAEVSDYSAQGYDGLGLVEIGILKGGNPPQHICPFPYLDPSIKDETFKKISALYKSWEEYRGDTTLYDESAYASPGCLTDKSING